MPIIVKFEPLFKKVVSYFVIDTQKTSIKWAYLVPSIAPFFFDEKCQKMPKTSVFIDFMVKKRLDKKCQKFDKFLSYFVILTPFFRSFVIFCHRKPNEI